MDESIELLVTVVVAADGEDTARDACEDFVWRIGGRVLETGDCSAEEPGCWGVTVRLATEERATEHHMAAPLARAVRRFVRELGPEVAIPRVSCEPPVAWTVLDDPAHLGEMVPGAERLLIEAWCGGDPLHLVSPLGLEHSEHIDEHIDDEHLDEQLDDEHLDEHIDEHIDEHLDPDDDDLTGAEEVADEPDRRPPAQTRTQVAERERIPEPGPWQAPPVDERQDYRLSLRVDVATVREAGAEWQARAVASRISRSVTLTGMTAHDGVLSVQIDLGPTAAPPPQTVLTAVSALDRRGWSPLRWEGDTASSRWVAQPRPDTGITELEVSSGPVTRRRH